VEKLHNSMIDRLLDNMMKTSKDSMVDKLQDSRMDKLKERMVETGKIVGQHGREVAGYKLENVTMKMFQKQHYGQISGQLDGAESRTA
jgi:hypothetical protein